jgi:hypothetical protein
MKHYSILFLLVAFFCAPIKGTTQELNFDGNNDYVAIDSVADDFAGLTSFTVEFWMKADKNAQTSIRVGMFAVNAPSSAGDNVFIITMGGMNAQDGKLLIVDNVTGFDFVSSAVIGDNTCHHIAYVRNNTISTMYIDGYPVGTHVPDYTFVPADRYSLGHEWDILTPSDHFEGTLEEVRLWNVARSPSEILNNKNQELTGTESGLIAYYSFNQGTAGGNNTGLTSLTDFTGNGNTGTLFNFALTGAISNWVLGCEGNISAIGIEENSMRGILPIYPNPASDVLTVNAILENRTRFEIINAQGQTLQCGTLEGILPVISIAELNSGVYYLRAGDINCRFVKY